MSQKNMVGSFLCMINAFKLCVNMLQTKQTWICPISVYYNKEK